MKSDQQRPSVSRPIDVFGAVVQRYIVLAPSSYASPGAMPRHRLSVALSRPHRQAKRHADRRTISPVSKQSDRPDGMGVMS